VLLACEPLAGRGFVQVHLRQINLSEKYSASSPPDILSCEANMIFTGADARRGARGAQVASSILVYSLENLEVLHL
jgi:hypothetical protein